MTQIQEATPAQLAFYMAAKERRARLNPAPIVEAPITIEQFIEPPIARPDPIIEKIEAILADVSFVSGVSQQDILAGYSDFQPCQFMIARKLVVALCVVRTKLAATEVADHFEVEHEFAVGAAKSLRAIFMTMGVSQKTPLARYLPDLWKTWLEEDVLVRRFPSIAGIQKAVATVFDVSVHDMISARRKSDIVVPRHVAMAICKRMTIKSLPEIGRKFGGRDHTTVLHAVRKLELVGDRIKLNDDPQTATVWAIGFKAALTGSNLYQGWK